MNLNKYILTYYRQNKIFIIAFIFSVITYSIYIIFRGFGWDGDSFISASQFIKIVNRDLYGTMDGGAHPKLFAIMLFGLVYQFTGGFYLLSFISIILNALMIGTLIKWVNEEKGIWLIAFTGILINIPWTKIVVNCDNPAFSIPFIIFGLYFISKDKVSTGIVLLIISNFFRTGSEFIIFILIIQALYNKKLKNVIFLGIALTITLIHSYWGYLLVYSTREIFWNSCWHFRVSPETITEYQYSFRAVFPYMQSIFKQLLEKYSIIFIIPASIGLVRILKFKLKISYVILLPLNSFILPVSTFLYGTKLIEIVTKHMGITILLPVLASFFMDSSILNIVGSRTKVFITGGILSLVILFSAFTGNLKHGQYETHVDGTGKVGGWTSLPDIKNDIKSIFPSEKINILTASKFRNFIILDIGKYAYNIDVLKSPLKIDISTINKYDLVVIPREFKELDIVSKQLSNLGYTIKSNNNSYVYYISNLTNN